VTIVLKVKGTPVPQGSMTCVGGGSRPLANGRVVAAHNVQPSNKADLYAWRDKIAGAARTAREKLGIWWIAQDPVQVDLTFTIERPKTITRDWPSVYPDLDKYCRAVLDGLTLGGIWNDDGQCVVLNAIKVYPDQSGFATFPGDVLDVPGVTIRLSDPPTNRLI
jgi:Holliday junction resolvase RusA-like endonuclease